MALLSAAAVPRSTVPRASGWAAAAGALALCTGLALQGCANTPSNEPLRDKASAGGTALSSSARVNLALKFDPRNPRLNFVNGLIYESQATAGSEWRELARIGYQMANRLDPSFWAADYQQGLLALEERSPIEAQLFLLSAAQKAPQEARVWYALARASQCAGDVVTAALSLQQAQALQPVRSAEEAETAALVSAASGDAVQAARWAEAFAATAAPAHAQELRRRVAELPKLAAAASPPSSAAANAAAMPPSSPASAARGPRAKRHTAVVDVVILRRNEVRSTTNGINLLDALKLQFGGNLLSTSWNRVTDRRLNTDTEDLVNRKRDVQLAIPTISYSLNIANAQSAATTVEARPTLLISDGTQSKIFTGGTLTYASDGQLASNSFTREVGLSLAVKPEFISDNLVNLTVSSTLEVFANTPAPGTFRQTLQTEKSATEISTDMRFGETVLIYGGRTTQTEHSESKTPVLGDVPLLRNAFSARTGSESDNGLLILLSLRERDDDADAREQAERRSVEQLGARVFAGAAPVARRYLRMEPNPRFYQLANPGRQFDAAYLADIGVDASLLQSPRP